MKEREIEKYLVRRVKALGGEVRKVGWIGRNGAPDRVVMLPDLCVWIELKATGKVAEPHQAREHDRMRKFGLRVEVIDSLESVDEVLG
jgi:hypothetical protein